MTQRCAQGRVLDDSTLPGMTESDRSAIWGDMSRILAALHRVDVHEVGLEKHGKVGGMAARQVIVIDASCVECADRQLRVDS